MRPWHGRNGVTVYLQPIDAGEPRKSKKETPMAQQYSLAHLTVLGCAPPK